MLVRFRLLFSRCHFNQRGQAVTDHLENEQKGRKLAVLINMKESEEKRNTKGVTTRSKTIGDVTRKKGRRSLHLLQKKQGAREILRPHHVLGQFSKTRFSKTLQYHE